MGISVTGGVCVHATPQDNSSPPALYIVGGKANSTQGGYQGFQRYVFGDGKWESIDLTAPVTQNRLYHNAIYLNASSSILMYAGTQDGSRQYTSHTFTISTAPPYQVLSFDSIAPPAISPLLLPWTDSQAAMIGGTDTNTKVMIFSPSSHWEDSNSSLEYPLKDDSAVKAVVITGDDGSKNLYTFDMTVSPNQVNRTILIDEHGSPIKNAKAISARGLSEASLETQDAVRSKTKRAHLTVAEWPTYNATLAPRTTRTEYAIAHDSNGLVVFSGGNANDVLCMFKARENCWANATALLGKAQAQIAIDATPSSVSTPSSASAPSSTQTPLQSTAESVGDSSPTSFNYKLLGLVLGSIVGFALLVLGVILFIRRRTVRRAFAEAGHQRRASGVPDEKDPMDFADRGISFDTATRYQRHARNNSQASISSMAILMGKVSSNQSRPVLGRRNGSNASDSSSNFNKKYKNAISKPIPQVRPTPPESFIRAERPAVVGASDPIPVPRGRASVANKPGSIRRSSGWNRYWSGGSALNILGFGNKRTTYASQSDRESVYSQGGLPSRVTQTSAMVPPLSLGHPPQGRMSQVPSGSPTIAHLAKGFPLEQGMAGQIERSHSVSSVSSYGDLRDAFSSGVPASVNEEQQTWTPVGGQGWGTNRAPSSIYTESNYAPTPSRTTMVEGTNRNPGSGFPSAPPYKTPAQRPSDMSWLNLGNGD